MGFPPYLINFSWVPALSHTHTHTTRQNQMEPHKATDPHKITQTRTHRTRQNQTEPDRTRQNHKEPNRSTHTQTNTHTHTNIQTQTDHTHFFHTHTHTHTHEAWRPKPPGVPESNSASKTVWTHRFKSILYQNSKTRLSIKSVFSL